MRKFFEYIGLLSLMCFSFFITEKTITIAKNVDNIMIDIKNNYKKYELKSSDALINDNFITPGICGKKVDLNKTYNEMKILGIYDDKLYQYIYYKPDINIDNNLDKYINRGNDYKNYIYIFFDLNNTNKYIINNYDFKYYNFIVQSDFYFNNQKIIKKLVDNNNSILIENTDFKKLKKVSKHYNDVYSKNIYCYNYNYDEKFLDMCSNNKNNSISKINKISDNYFLNIKKNLKKGNFYKINLSNDMIKKLKLIEEYIDSKGISRSSIDIHLKEC